MSLLQKAKILDKMDKGMSIIMDRHHYGVNKRSSTCILYDVTCQSSECSQRINGEIIGVPLLTGYSTGGYKFANCGCKPSSYSLQLSELCYSTRKAREVDSKLQNEFCFLECAYHHSYLVVH